MAYYFNPMMIDFVLLWSVNRVFTIQYLLAIKKSQQDIKRTNNRICQFWIYNQPQTFSNATQPKFLSWIKDLRRNKSTFLSTCCRISIFPKMRRKWEAFITGRHFEFLRATISSTLPPAIFTVICPYQFENSNTRHDTFAVTFGGPDSSLASSHLVIILVEHPNCWSVRQKICKTLVKVCKSFRNKWQKP